MTILFSYMGKSSSYIPTSKVIRSCSYGKISLKTSNAFESSISNEMLIYANELFINNLCYETFPICRLMCHHVASASSHVACSKHPVKMKRSLRNN